MSSQQTHTRCSALTIAGFDPSGGAGVIADVRTFAAFDLEGVAAITSITFQNSERVSGAVHMTGESVRSQVMPLIEGGQIVCVKTGMLPTREVVLEVARLFRETDLPRPVVDPVIMSSSGYRLMEEDAIAALIDELLPQSAIANAKHSGSGNVNRPDNQLRIRHARGCGKTARDGRACGPRERRTPQSAGGRRQ